MAYQYEHLIQQIFAVDWFVLHVFSAMDSQQIIPREIQMNMWSTKISALLSGNWTAQFMEIVSVLFRLIEVAWFTAACGNRLKKGCEKKMIDCAV